MWTKTETETLITLYQEWPILYDTKHKDYLNRLKRKEALEIVRKGMQKVRPGTSIADIKKKIKTLRSQFLKEKNKLNDLNKNGSGTNDIHESSLWCFDMLQFLNPRLNEVSKESGLSWTLSTLENFCYENASVVSDLCDEMSQDQDSFSDVPQRKKRKSSALQESVIDCISLLKDLARGSTETSTPIDTPPARLGKLVTEELAEVAEDIFFVAKWKIIEILKEASIANMQRKNSVTSEEVSNIHPSTQSLKKNYSETFSSSEPLFGSRGKSIKQEPISFRSYLPTSSSNFKSLDLKTSTNVAEFPINAEVVKGVILNLPNTSQDIPQGDKMKPEVFHVNK